MHTHIDEVTDDLLIEHNHPIEIYLIDVYPLSRFAFRLMLKTIPRVKSVAAIATVRDALPLQGRTVLQPTVVIVIGGSATIYDCVQARDALKLGQVTLSHLYDKLGVSSRTEALVRAQALRLLPQVG